MFTCISRDGSRLSSGEQVVAVVNVTRSVALLIVALFVISIGLARAEQAEPNRTKSASQSQPKLIIRSDELFPLTPPTRLGMFTLVPPDTNGEFIRMATPVGELLSRAARAISDANHRRAERKADGRVRKDLEQFLVASKTKNASIR